MTLTFEHLKAMLADHFENYYNNFEKYVSALWDWSQFSWDNPFFLVTVITFLTIGMEFFLPKKKPYSVLERKGFWQDLLYVFFTDFVLFAMGLYALLAITEICLYFFLMKLGIKDFRLYDIAKLPAVVQFLLLFTLSELLQFIGHYLLHRVDFLWQFHKIHHAQTTLGAASTRHFHWFEYVMEMFLFIPFAIIGYPFETYFIYSLWITSFFGFFSHSNIKIKWGPLSYIFINPDTHFWHHSKNLPEGQKYGVNFASILPLWDLIFGTYYNPEGEEPTLGIVNDDVPKSFLGQFIYPFIVNFTKIKLPLQNGSQAKKKFAAKPKSSTSVKKKKYGAK